MSAAPDVVAPSGLGAMLAAVLEALTQNAGADTATVRAAIASATGAQPRLVSHVETYDGSVHHAALISLDGGGTATVSYAPPSGIPWPLRGAQRWSEQELLRVEGRTLSVQQAMAFLDFVWDDRDLTRGMIDSCLIAEELERAPVELSPEEVQEAVDEWRWRHRLTEKAVMEEWLRQRGISLRRLVDYVCDERRVEKLRDRIAADLPAEATRTRTTSRDRIALLVEGVAPGATQTVARLLGDGVGPGSPDLLQLVRERSIRAVQRVRVGGSGTERLAEAIGDAAPGEVAGPFILHGASALCRVEEVLDAPEEVARERAAEELFRRWLDERRAAARIEWNWGRGEDGAD